MKIAVFSDLHLDSPFVWAGSDGGRKRRQALRDTLVRIIDLALDQKVDAICCGGDLFEHDRVSPDTGMFLKRQFERAIDVPIYIAPGNHDWIGPRSLYRQAEWTPNVHVFDGALRAEELQEGITLWGGGHQRPAGTRNFLDGFRVDRSGVHLGLFHGAVLGPFAEEGKALHAAFDASQVAECGLHFAMLGHYHAPRDEHSFTYPGNPDPLTFGESGQRGVVIITVLSNGTITLERHVVARTVLHDLLIDVTGCASKQEVLDRFTEELADAEGFARIRLTGELATTIDLSASDLADLPTRLSAKPLVEFAMRHAYDLIRLREEPTVRGQFVRDVEASNLPAEQKARVLITGLRALDGRDDLEVA